MIEGAQEGVVETNAESVITYVSPRAAEIVERPVDDIVGQHIANIIGADTWTSLADRRSLTRSGRPSAFELQIETPSGEPRWIVASVSPDYRRGGFDGTLQFITDITEERKIGEQRRALIDELAGVEIVERRNLARELHDGPLQELVAVNLALGHALTTDDAVAKPVLIDAEAVLSQAIGSLRHGLAPLHQSDIVDGGLIDALTAHSRRVFHRSNTRWAIDCNGAIPSGPLAAALFLIGREATTNCARHARASSMQLTVTTTDTSTSLEVTDDGVGFVESPLPTGPGHIGVMSMRSRSLALGGTFTIQARPDGGTVVRVDVPR